MVPTYRRYRRLGNKLRSFQQPQTIRQSQYKRAFHVIKQEKELDSSEGSIPKEEVQGIIDGDDRVSYGSSLEEQVSEGAVRHMNLITYPV